MTVRIWHGVTSATKADEYHSYLNQTGVPDYQATERNRGVYVLRRIEDARVHFLKVSLGDSTNTIKGFAGLDPERARYYPEDEEFLVEFEAYPRALPGSDRFSPTIWAQRVNGRTAFAGCLGLYETLRVVRLLYNL